MIVKVQQSQFSSVGPSVLIYNEDRSMTYETHEPDEVKPVADLLGDKPKAYFEAEVVDTKFVLGDEVENPGW